MQMLNLPQLILLKFGNIEQPVKSCVSHVSSLQDYASIGISRSNITDAS